MMNSSAKHGHKKNSSEENRNVEELLKKIQELTNMVDSIEEAKIGLQNQLQKALADYRNLEKNMEDRVGLSVMREKRSLLSGFIELMDDIKFALKAGEKLGLKGEGKAWLDGVVDTLSKMEHVLSSVGVQIIEVKAGDQFDSKIHEAIAVISVKTADNTIVEVSQPGYMMDNVVIRPARVVINKSNK
ncbi:nucleotide exchange factor GrpE [Candidatus Nomurabacteria bacterium]|nr:nucleotide exchange factor GrpE [Candidatus Nomurabacteria bacterium]